MFFDWCRAHSHQMGLGGHLRRDLWILAPFQWFLPYSPWLLAAAPCFRQHTGSSSTENGKAQYLLAQESVLYSLSAHGHVWHFHGCSDIVFTCKTSSAPLHVLKCFQNIARCIAGMKCAFTIWWSLPAPGCIVRRFLSGLRAVDQQGWLVCRC